VSFEMNFQSQRSSKMIYIEVITRFETTNFFLISYGHNFWKKSSKLNEMSYGSYYAS